MVLTRRYCVEYVDGTIECFRDGFWYSDKGIIIKWAILGSIFFFFMAWFLGGYIHAKSRMKKGKPLLAYHRWLVPYSVRRQYGQVPQNHFTFYAAQPYGQQRQDGTWSEPPPMYGGDAPPGYYPPPGATKMNPNQNANTMEMPQYGVPPPQSSYPMGQQQTGVVGAGAEGFPSAPPQGGNSGDGLPPRPVQAKVALQNFVSRFRR